MVSGASILALTDYNPKIGAVISIVVSLIIAPYAIYKLYKEHRNGTGILTVVIPVVLGIITAQCIMNDFHVTIVVSISFLYCVIWEILDALTKAISNIIP